MALSTNDFGKAVVAAGLMPADALKSLWDALPADARPKSADAFAKLLIKQGTLNEFQSQELLSGSGTPLVLGDYVLLAKIGAGGMGQVFKAQHRHMKRLAAIKLLPAAMTKDEGAVKRFQREVQAAAKLSHPNIVQTHDAGVQRGVWYLVMEYVEGQDLSGLLKTNGPLPIDKAVNYILQAARGLAFAHSEGVVHRDIKPANLLLDKKGVVKILDMGLARFEGNDSADHQLTNTGAVMGTVDYMAPEQAFDAHAADARADIYSLGCSLYRLLTCENMYGGTTIMQKFIAHREQPIPSLLVKRHDAPPELDHIFQKMVAKQPDSRYQNGSELVTALDGYTSATGLKANVAASQATSLSALGGSLGVSLATDVGDGMTAVLCNQRLLGLPDSRVVPRDETFSSSVHERTQPSHRKEKTVVQGGKQPPWKNPLVLITAGVAGFLVLLLSVWVIVRDKDGKPAAKVQVSDGGSVNVKETILSPFGKQTEKTGVASPEAATHPSNVDSDRRAAEWVLNKEGVVDVVINNVWQQVTIADRLPQVPFQLTTVSLREAMNGEGTKILSGLTALVELDVKGSKLADDDVRPLGTLTKLELLNLESVPIGNAALLHLSLLSNLKEVWLKGTNVTVAGVAALQRALPDCKIEWDDPAKTTSPPAK